MTTKNKQETKKDAGRCHANKDILMFHFNNDATLKKSGLNVNSDSFITMVSRHSMTLPSTSDAFWRSSWDSQMQQGCLNFNQNLQHGTSPKNRICRKETLTGQCLARKSNAVRKKVVSSDWWKLSCSICIWLMCSFMMLISTPSWSCGNTKAESVGHWDLG